MGHTFGCGLSRQVKCGAMTSLRSRLTTAGLYVAHPDGLCLPKTYGPPGRRAVSAI